MTKKRKKKRRIVRKQVPLKGKELERHFKIFINRVVQIAEAFDARQVIERLPDSEIIVLYKLRHRFPKVTLQEGLPMNTGFLGAVKKWLGKNYFDKVTFTFPGYEEKIPCKDYYVYVLTIYQWFTAWKDGHPGQVIPLEEKLSPLIRLVEEEENERHPNKLLGVYLDILAWSVTKKPHLLICYFKTKLEHITEPDFGFFTHITLMMVRGETQTAKIDGHNRLVFLVAGWKNGVLRRPKIDCAKFRKNTNIRDLKMDVYMQKHALDRLTERLHIFNPQELYFFVSDSIDRGLTEPFGRDRVLLGYYFYGQLLGYLVIQVFEGIAVIRTFLFLTNDDTPQGKELKRLLKVGKMDKSYTGLDQISTFIHGKLDEDKELYSLLCDAGCEALMNLHPAVVKRGRREEAIMSIDKIREYLAF